MTKRKIEKCWGCFEKIIPSAHKVCISTFNRYKDGKSLPDEHAWFHIQCWADYFNSRVEKKVRNQVQFMQSKALEVFNNPEIRSILSRIKGTENLFQMLNTDLTEKTVPKEKVVAKIQDDRRKKQKTKNKKAKM